MANTILPGAQPGLARTIYIGCIYNNLGREITKYTVIYGVYIRFWPTLHICQICTDCLYVFLARTIYTRCTYGIFGLEITKYTVYIYVYIRFWPTLFTCRLLQGFRQSQLCLPSPVLTSLEVGCLFAFYACTRANTLSRCPVPYPAHAASYGIHTSSHALPTSHLLALTCKPDSPFTPPLSPLPLSPFQKGD